MELIRPMVKERFAKINDLGGKTWEDAPVRSPIPPKHLLFTKRENRTIC